MIKIHWTDHETAFYKSFRLQMHTPIHYYINYTPLSIIIQQILYICIIFPEYIFIHRSLPANSPIHFLLQIVTQSLQGCNCLQKGKQKVQKNRKNRHITCSLSLFLLYGSYLCYTAFIGFHFFFQNSGSLFRRQMNLR